MSEGLRKLVDLGAGGTIHPGSAGDLRFHGNRQRLADSATGHVRLWADWPSLQPDPKHAIDDPENPGFARLEALDEQIRAAAEDGVRVILVAYRFPPWANGTEGLAAQRNTDAEASFRPEDRMTPAAWDRYVRAGRDPAIHNPFRRGLELRIPDDLGTGSEWAEFIEFLLARYGAHRAGAGGTIHALELTNEPNYQWWPQRAPTPEGDPFALGELTAPAAFAEAMRTAQHVSARFGHRTLLLGPGTADSRMGGRLVTRAEAFTPALLDALERRGYRAHPEQVWSHHNYDDLEERREETVTQRVRALLAGRWEGRAAGDGPAIWITEGGVRIYRMRSLYPQEDPLEAQATSWRLAWERHRRPDGAGAGVEMLAQYTLFAEPGFDCGLLDPWPAGRERPAWHAWRSFPQRRTPPTPSAT